MLCFEVLHVCRQVRQTDRRTPRHAAVLNSCDDESQLYTKFNMGYPYVFAANDNNCSCVVV